MNEKGTMMQFIKSEMFHAWLILKKYLAKNKVEFYLSILVLMVLITIATIYIIVKRATEENEIYF